MEARERLIAALDFTDGDVALELANRVRGEVGLVKVGLPLVVGAGLGVIDRLRGEGHGVLLDLKYHDLPDRVAAAVRAAARKAVTMMTVSALGGRAVLRAAMHALSEVTIVPGVPPPRIVATTLFSHVDDADLRELGFAEDAQALTLRLARLALEAGVDGVMVAPRHVAAVRAAAGPEPLLLCPGVRAPGNALDPHGVEAADCIRAGASHLIVGAPLRRATDPAALARALAQEVAHATA